MGVRALLLCLLVSSPLSALADEAALRTRLAEPRQGVEIDSRDDGERVVGEIYAVLPQSFESSAAVLKDPSSWCEILMLHLDTKECRVTRDASGPIVQAGVVTHYDQPASSAYHVQFHYRLARETADYLEARLDAEEGPIDTRDFDIVFEGVRTPEGRMLAHMAYSYRYGTFSRVALGLYLVTFGRGKAGFTVVGRDDAGQPKYVGGMRGVVERNTMRYYLAVEAWLASNGGTRAQRVERALRNWYAAVERYPRQLHELGEERYLEMKRSEMGVR